MPRQSPTPRSQSRSAFDRFMERNIVVVSILVGLLIVVLLGAALS